MNLAQLLGRQSRPEIPVMLANDRQRLAANRLGRAGCWSDRGASRSGPSGHRGDRPSATETPDGARAPVADPPSRSSVAADPNPAAPRAAKAFHRSSAVPSPPTPPGNPPGSVICNWQRGDILIGRLHAGFGRGGFWKLSGRAHGAQERPVPVRNGCIPNAPEGGHSTQAGTPFEIAPVEPLDPPALAVPGGANPAFPTPLNGRQPNRPKPRSSAASARTTPRNCRRCSWGLSRRRRGSKRRNGRRCAGS
jgi:hypothetical protein